MIPETPDGQLQNQAADAGTATNTTSEAVAETVLTTAGEEPVVVPAPEPIADLPASEQPVVSGEVATPAAEKISESPATEEPVVNLNPDTPGPTGPTGELGSDVNPVVTSDSANGVVTEETASTTTADSMNLVIDQGPVGEKGSVGDAGETKDSIGEQGAGNEPTGPGLDQTPTGPHDDSIVVKEYEEAVPPIASLEVGVASIDHNGGSGDKEGFTIRLNALEDNGLMSGGFQMKHELAMKFEAGKKYKVTIQELV
jgi:hypothetical protein